MSNTKSGSLGVLRDVGILGISLVAILRFSLDVAVADELLIIPARSINRGTVARLNTSELSTGAKRNWGPEQVAGPPDVAAAGTSPQAWASLSADGQKEWLLCEYAAPIEARAVIVHESAFPGGLTKVSAFNSDGDEIIAWEGADPTPLEKPRGVSVIPIKLALKALREQLQELKKSQRGVRPEPKVDNRQQILKSNAACGRNENN